VEAWVKYANAGRELNTDIPPGLEAPRTAKGFVMAFLLTLYGLRLPQIVVSLQFYQPSIRETNLVTKRAVFDGALRNTMPASEALGSTQ
jgi:hypothetical protein